MMSDESYFLSKILNDIIDFLDQQVKSYHIYVILFICQILSSCILKLFERFSHFQGSLQHTTKEQALELSTRCSSNNVNSMIPLHSG